jgi:hypothetical protein
MLPEIFDRIAFARTADQLRSLVCFRSSGAPYTTSYPSERRSRSRGISSGGF